MNDFYNASENKAISSDEPAGIIGSTYDVVFYVDCPVCECRVENPYDYAGHWSTQKLSEELDLYPGDTVRLDCDHDGQGERTTFRIRIPTQFGF